MIGLGSDNYHIVARHLKSDHVVDSVCFLNDVLSLCCLPQRVLENSLSCRCQLVKGVGLD